LCAKAEAETSAQTGRPSILAVLVTPAVLAAAFPDCVFLEVVRVCAMVFPEEKIVYDIRPALTERARQCHVKDNSTNRCNRAAEPFRRHWHRIGHSKPLKILEKLWPARTVYATGTGGLLPECPGWHTLTP
jgi:hypothetical protein